MIRRVLAAAGLLAAAVAGRASGQNSGYAVQGIGFPQRGLGVVARALGGGPGSTDPESALNPAAAGLFDNLSVGVLAATDFRSLRTGGSTTSGLKGTRFPHALVGGRLPNTPLAVAFGYSAFAERSFDLATTDTITLRGARVGVTDRVASDGGLADLRGAIAWTPNSHLMVGLAGHIISGSTKFSTAREFSDPAYRTFADTVNQSFAAYGVSTGVLVSSGNVFRFGGSVRFDTRLRSEVSGRAERVSLPVTVSLGGQVAPVPAIRLSSTFLWKSWSRASADLTAAGHGQAFDTWELGAGLQIGGPESGATKFPLRLGFRRARLPFSAVADRPTETDLTAGTGVRFAGGRARFDVTVERAMRDGGGARERAWQLLFGLQVSP
jgi:hypothetical protein